MIGRFGKFMRGARLEGDPAPAEQVAPQPPAAATPATPMDTPVTLARHWAVQSANFYTALVGARDELSPALQAESDRVRRERDERDAIAVTAKGPQMCVYPSADCPGGQERRVP